MTDEYDYLAGIKPRIYLAGPMENVNEEEGNAWRQEVTLLLAKQDLQAINPYYLEQERNRPKFLVKTDLRAILHCEGMIINASQDVVTWGTPMEVLWAHMHRVINVAFTGSIHSHPSPWLLNHAEIVSTPEQAVEVMAWKIQRL